MDIPEFSVYIHYRKKSVLRGNLPEEKMGERDSSDEGDPIDAKDDLTYRSLCEFLRSDFFSGVGSGDRGEVEGISILQFSKNPVFPRSILLRHQELMSLASHKCFFWMDVCTENWKKTRHRLDPFYVLSFRRDRNQYLGDVQDVGYMKVTSVRGKSYHSYILRPDEMSSFLQSSLFRQYKENYRGDCRIDYFTTNPWIALFLDHHFLGCFLGSMMGLQINVHQNMKVARNDGMYSLFEYIRRNKRVRMHINDGSQTG